MFSFTTVCSINEERFYIYIFFFFQLEKVFFFTYMYQDTIFYKINYIYIHNQSFRILF